MKRLVQIASIQAVDQETKNYLAEKLEDSGLMIIHDSCDDSCCYVVEQQNYGTELMN